MDILKLITILEMKLYHVTELHHFIYQLKNMIKKIIIKLLLFINYRLFKVAK